MNTLELSQKLEIYTGMEVCVWFDGKLYPVVAVSTQNTGTFAHHGDNVPDTELSRVVLEVE